jgi:hypothetical protein
MTDPSLKADQAAFQHASEPVTAEGVAQELPATKPFEGFFYLRKEWVDQEEGIDRVTFNMTVSPLHLPADWNTTQTFVMMPEWGTAPLRRTWIVRLPTHYQGSDRYLFHYFFQVTYTNGQERVSNAFTNLIVPHEFEFIDHSGDFLQVRLHWSVGSWSYPQDTDLEADGIDWGSEFSVSHFPYRGNDKLYQKGRLLVMRRLPIPRRFRGLIWAPKGSEIRYCFQMLRPGPQDELEILWDNNFGRDFRLTI